MFEKESQDYAMREVASRQELYIKGRADIDADYEKVKKIWQDGAEFAYNKANEWHYNEVPKNDNDILCQISKDEVVVGYYHTVAKRYITIDGQDLYNVIAWKEIVLPELKESK
jgi:hypothetical protein